ncbi:MAG: molybdopterin-dependent oxidoreductase [Myxococcales bacterium]|nr:molybdopterin-dependent oxidoreductase [Myxococcales bacterium]
MGTSTHHTFCRICEALCGLEVDVDSAGRVREARPDARHVGTGGFACVKGVKQHELYDSPDRLLRPLLRDRAGQPLRAASWREALRASGSAIARIRRDHGPDAVAMYVGTAAGFSVLHPIFADGFMKGIGSRSIYSTATQDCANKFAVAQLMYGFAFTQPFPDVDNTRCLFIVGANPAVSKWSFLQVSNPVQRLREMRARGARVVVIDPRRTETARVASEHVAIRPDTDVFFYLSFLQALLARPDGAAGRAQLEGGARGFEQVAALAARWPAERTAPVTGIDAALLRRLVDEYVQATCDGGAALYLSTGVNMGSAGSLCFWLQEVINALSGNLDRRGGTLVGQGIVDFARFCTERGLLGGDGQTRIGALPQVNDALPAGVLADEITTPGRGQVRALIVTGGNPLLTVPNSAHLAEALGELELLVSVDIVLGETASMADVVLPATTPYERADLPFVFSLLLGMQSRPYLQATRAVVAPPGEVRDEATIYLALARAAGVSLFGSRAAQLALEGLSAGNGLWRWLRGERRAGAASVPQELLLDALLRAARQPSFRRLLGERHGLALDAEARAGTFIGQRVYTRDGKIDLAPAALLAEAERTLEPRFAAERARSASGALKLIGRRAVRSHNSWTHNARSLVRERPSNVLYMHPDDAAERGLAQHAIVDVTSQTGRVRLPLALSDDLARGVVALPHGWGHQRARGLSVASKLAGVNVNLLAADGPQNLERVSGMAQLTGIVVAVTPAAGPRDTTSWSGVAGE